MTALDDALARRDEAREIYQRDTLKVDGRHGGGRFQAVSMADLPDAVPPERRLAIGVAFGASKNTLGLALRVARRNSAAHRAARALADRAEADGSWADLRVVERVAMPSRQDVVAVDVAAAAAQAFPLGGDPLMLGVSVAHPRAPAGSLGGFVRIRDAGDGIIGSCHILANGGRGVNLSSPQTAPAIYHPAPKDLPGRVTSQHQIGVLHRFVPLDTAPVELDVAVAVLNPARQVAGNTIPSIAGATAAGAAVVGPPPRAAVPTITRVAKVGRASGYTEARLSSGFYNDVPLDVPGMGLVYYDALFEIESDAAGTAFARPGDSGAAVFDVATRAAFALVVGGGEWDDNGRSRMLVYACDLAAALDAVDAEWI